ncbi:MAG: class I SAM-dependent methyltransferase [Flavobacteriales bacterium]
MNTSVVAQAYWDESYEQLQFRITDRHDPVRQWIEQHISKTEGATCLEVGCFPGRYLAVFGQLGYELHGIDLTPRISELSSWLTQSGYKTGDFTHADFLKHTSAEQYDVVCSFGFVEHFTNWREVLQKHADMIKTGGTLIMETPNFRGWMQYFLHKHLDAENFARHHIDAMQPDVWKNLLEASGFEIKWHGHFGAFDFWSDTRHYNFLQKLGLRFLTLAKPMLKKLPEGKKSIAPYCGIVAVKR